jgi:curli biogenesis system outer membrane secretion channel CsgG
MRLLSCILMIPVLLAFGSPALADDAVDVVLTSDTEGHVEPCNGCPGRKGLGGLARRATLLRALRTEAPALIAVDAGNALFGAGSLGSEGRVMSAAYAELGYAALNLSYRDFRLGKEVCLARISGLPFVSANIRDSASGELLCQPYRIVEAGSQKLAFVGLSARPAGLKVLKHLRRQLAGVRIDPPRQALEATIDDASKAADSVILLYYGGAEAIAGLCAGLESKLAAVFVGGTKPDQLPETSAVPTVAALGHGRELALASLDQGKLGRSAMAVEPGLAEDPAMNEVLAKYRPTPSIAAKPAAAPTPTAAANPSEAAPPSIAARPDRDAMPGSTGRPDKAQPVNQDKAASETPRPRPEPAPATPKPLLDDGPQATPPAPAAPRKRLKSIAVLSFNLPKERVEAVAKTDTSAEQRRWIIEADTALTQILTAKLTAELSTFKTFTVVERRRLDEIEKEIDLSKGGKVDPARAIAVGKLIGADILVIGEIDWSWYKGAKKVPFTSFSIASGGFVLDAQVRLLDSRSGEVLSALEVRGVSNRKSMSKKPSNISVNIHLLREARAILNRNIARAIYDELHPAQVISTRNGKIYINRGRLTGVSLGDRFQLERRTVIVDETTGVEFEEEPEIVGAIEVVSVSKRIARVELRAGSAAVTDRCRALPKTPKAPAKRKPGKPPGW